MVAAPPTYAECIGGAVDILDDEDDEAQMFGSTSYTPMYTYVYEHPNYVSPPAYSIHRQTNNDDVRLTDLLSDDDDENEAHVLPMTEADCQSLNDADCESLYETTQPTPPVHREIRGLPHSSGGNSRSHSYRSRETGRRNFTAEDSPELSFSDFISSVWNILFSHFWIVSYSWWANSMGQCPIWIRMKCHCRFFLAKKYAWNYRITK